MPTRARTVTLLVAFRPTDMPVTTNGRLACVFCTSNARTEETRAPVPGLAVTADAGAHDCASAPPMDSSAARSSTTEPQRASRGRGIAAILLLLRLQPLLGALLWALATRRRGCRTSVAKVGVERCSTPLTRRAEARARFAARRRGTLRLMTALPLSPRRRLPRRPRRLPLASSSQAALSSPPPLAACAPADEGPARRLNKTAGVDLPAPARLPAVTARD